MNAEQKFIALSLALSVWCVSFIVAYSMKMLEPYFEGMQPLMGFLQKFPYDLAPMAPMTRIAWLTFWTPLVTGHLFLYRLASTVRVLDKKFYLTWSFNMICSSFWFFLFGYEKLVKMAVGLTLPTICSYIMLIIALRRRVNDDARYSPIPEASRWWFDRCIIDGTAFFVVWYTYSVLIFGGTAVLYEEGPCKNGQPRGLINPETCAFAGICCFVLAMAVLTVIDLVVFPCYTKHVRSGYFAVIYTSLAVAVTMCMNRRDFHPNAAILTAVALVAALVRRKRGQLQLRFGRHFKSD